MPEAGIDWLIDAYTHGSVTDEQMAAMAMAIFFRGLDPDELSRWTNAMIASGERMSFASLSRPTVDQATPPAVSGTRSPCRWPHWWPLAARPSPS